jgi:hypothetical protein
MIMNNENKRILARACDTYAAQLAAHFIPRAIGNPEYIATTDDVDFLNRLQTESWDVVFFAPGACRYNAVSRPIPGSGGSTRHWSLNDYKAAIKQYQGQIPVVESLDESNTIKLLRQALEA